MQGHARLHGAFVQISKRCPLWVGAAHARHNGLESRERAEFQYPLSRGPDTLVQRTADTNLGRGHAQLHRELNHTETQMLGLQRKCVLGFWSHAI